MTADDRTRITMAIPLHRSARFVDVVSANIERIADDDVEILVSDRTMLDDALAQLRDRHAGDPRVRFVERSDGLDLVDHYNALLTGARGRYFVWFPHDDDIPPDFLPLLSDALDRNPDALLAFGRIRAVDEGGAELHRRLPDPPFELGQRARSAEAAALLQRWPLWIAFRGLMRRDEILRRRLTVRRLGRRDIADGEWAFAVAASAPIVFEPQCWFAKRYYPTSTHATWGRRSSIDELATVPVCAGYLTAARITPQDRARLLRFVAIRAIQRSPWALPDGLRNSVPAPVRHTISTLLQPIVRRAGDAT